MEDNNTLWLCALLKCGSLDLKVLTDLEIDDIDDLVKQVNLNYKEVTLGGIVNEAFYMAVADMNECITNKIVDLEEELNQMKELELHGMEDEMDKLSKDITSLKSLDLDSDASLFFNYIDTSISLENYDVYEKFVPDAIKAVEKIMGMEFIR